MVLLTKYIKHSFHIQNITRLWRKNIVFFSKKSDSISKENNSKFKPIHNIVNNKKDKYFMNQENETYIIQNEFLQGKRLISISPGGFKGFYLFGTLSFIKENYDLSDFIYSGASAGAWNALFMCLKQNNINDSYLKTLIDDQELKKTNSIQDFEKKMKNKLLLYFKNRENEFDFRRLFIGVTTISNDYELSTTIYNDFENLEDAINCCIASSHIPFITGGMINKYNGRLTFDGGFKSNPYLNINQSILHVSPSMWIKIKESISNDKGIAIKSNPSFFGNLKIFIEQTTLFKKDNIDFSKLYEEGYKEAKENKAILDDIMIYKNYSTNYYYT
jgi:hypothetical protein